MFCFNSLPAAHFTYSVTNSLKIVCLFFVPPLGSTFHNGRPDLELKLTSSHLPQNSHQKTIPSDHRHSNKVRSGSVSSSQSFASSVTDDSHYSTGSKKLGKGKYKK